MSDRLKEARSETCEPTKRNRIRGGVSRGERAVAKEVTASRLKEAAAMGFRTVYLPFGDAAEAGRFQDLSVRPVDRLADFLKVVR